MSRRARAALAAALAGCGGAAPRDQWVVFVGTDAPVPELGQQLVVEVLDERGQLESPDARRFIDAAGPDAWPISFGVVPASARAQPRIRVRLYRLDQTGSDGLPSGASLLDATATLPVAAGVTRVGLALPMACFGVASDPAAKRTCDPATKRLAAEPTLAPDATPEGLPAPGSWPSGAPVACRASAPAGMACVRGGAFLMGSQQFFPDTPPTDPLPQHLIVLAPFAIDLAEVTVGQVRALVRAGTVPAPLARGSAASGVRTDECTYRGAGDASNDGAPANCLPWGTADLACRAMDKRLPTEAEWEYVARNLDEETPYPWGSNPGACNWAVVARGVGVFADATECEPLGGSVAPGPVVGGAALDATDLGVLNLGGNVGEWTADFFAPYSAGCWSGGDPLVGPSCQSPSSAHTVRGGSWQWAVSKAASTAQSAPESDGASEAVGFRCAQSM